MSVALHIFFFIFISFVMAIFISRYGVLPYPFSSHSLCVLTKCATEDVHPVVSYCTSTILFLKDGFLSFFFFGRL